jgi:outer membrane lipoprotein SlyB
MKSIFSNLMAVVTAVTLAACGSTGGGMMGGGGSPPPVEIRTGTIEQINATEVKSTHDQGLGAIIGGVAGAGLGSLIGAGTGRDVAIAAGAIAGAIGGNVAQNRFFDKPQPAQQVIVRLTTGVLVAITQPVNPGLSRGMRVYVEGQGHEARVVPA